MTPFEEGFHRTMKVAGLLTRLRRAPSSLRELPETHRAIGEMKEFLPVTQDRAQRAWQKWKGNPEATLEDHDTDKLIKALQQATTGNVPQDPREGLLRRLQRVQREQDDIASLQRVRAEQLKDVGIAGATAAAPLVGAGAVYAGNRE